MEIKYETVRAIIAKDVVHNTHTVFLENGKTGGPIVSAETEDEAKAKFSEALNLACAVRNLRFYAKVVKDAETIKATEIKNLNLLIDYIPLPIQQC